MRDYYRILGIRPDATQEEIKEAWTFSVKAFHPDKFARSSQRQHAVAQERTKAINEAYEVLADPIKRAGYDREYARKPRTHSAAQPPPQPPSTSPPQPPPTPPQDGIRAEKCRNCGGRVFGHGVRDKLGIFCSTVCRNNFKHPGFCNVCIGASTPISAGDNFRINGIGNSFFGAKDQCEICGSIVQIHWFCIFFIPVVPSGKFRVKYVAPGSFLSRKLPKIHSAAQPPPRPIPPQKVSKSVRRTLLSLSVGLGVGLILSVGLLLLLIGGAAYYFQKSNDVVGRSMDDLVQGFAAPINGMNGQLRALGEIDVSEPYVLSNRTILEAEARKRIEGQCIIEKFRNDLPHVLDAFRQKAASYNISEQQKQALMSGFEKARPTLSHHGETICNLLAERERSELDFLHFMASAYNKYELKDGKVFFRSPTAGQRYSEFVKSFENSDKEIDAARKEWPNIKTNIRKLSQ